MATSGSTDFTSTRNDIINDAFRCINVIAENETASGYDMQLASRVLNRMVKAWIARGLHLWTKTTGYLFLQKSQAKYELGPSSADHVTDTYYSTTLTAAAVVTDTTLTVSSTANLTVGDYIGIKQDDNTLHWTTVSVIPDSTTVQIASGLTAAAASGNIVYNYTTKIQKISRVISANYRDSSNRDILMNEYSYQEYFELPTKLNEGTPVAYAIDNQRDTVYINIWQTPANVNFFVPFTYQRTLQDFDAATDNPDFPTEWQDCIVSNLGVRLAGFYGKNAGDRYNDLKMNAALLLSDAEGFDNEQGSMLVQPNYQGGHY
jgi:hypothetical protein